MWYCLCLSGRPAPLSFCCKCKNSNHLCGGRPGVIIKHVYGFSECHKKGLVFLVNPELLLDVGTAQGGQTLAR